MLNHDNLSMSPAHATVQTAYGALSAIQDAPADQQVASIGVLFLHLCNVLDLDPGQQLDAACRRTFHAREHFSVELKALTDYITHELENP